MILGPHLPCSQGQMPIRTSLGQEILLRLCKAQWLTTPRQLGSPNSHFSYTTLSPLPPKKSWLRVSGHLTCYYKSWNGCPHLGLNYNKLHHWARPPPTQCSSVAPWPTGENPSHIIVHHLITIVPGQGTSWFCALFTLSPCPGWPFPTPHTWQCLFLLRQDPNVTFSRQLLWIPPILLSKPVKSGTPFGTQCPMLARSLQGSSVLVYYKEVSL